MAGAAFLQMDVRVLKARQHQAPTRIDHAGRRRRQRADLRVVAERHDASSACCERRHARLQRIHGADVAVDDDEVCHDVSRFVPGNYAQSGRVAQEARHSE